jgi:hypothetical protein
MCRAKLFGLAMAAAASAHCEANDYSLQPSFCDDWCRVLLRTGCDEEPENCVRTCERSRAPAACASRERALLTCYEAQPPSAFGCSDQGFPESTRPEESTCPAERDALVDCAYPDVKECLDVCREIESGVPDAPGLEDEDCPSLDIPCDSLCWAGRAYTEGVPLDAGTSRGLSRLILDCAVGRAAECRLVPDVGVPKANWASVLADCADTLSLAGGG